MRRGGPSGLSMEVGDVFSVPEHPELGTAVIGRLTGEGVLRRRDKVLCGDRVYVLRRIERLNQVFRKLEVEGDEPVERVGLLVQPAEKTENLKGRRLSFQAGPW